MDPLLILGAFILGVVLGHNKSHATYEPVFQELRRRVQAAEETVAELEAEEQPAIERRLLERLYRE
jgi:cell division protein FtsB